MKNKLILILVLSLCIALSALALVACDDPYVDPVIPPQTPLTLQSTNVSLDVYDQAQLVVTSGSTDANVWTSKTPSVATVDANGLVTAVSAGNCEIQLTNENGTVSCHVVVTNSYTAPVLVCENTTAEMTKGSEFVVAPQVLYKNQDVTNQSTISYHLANGQEDNVVTISQEASIATFTGKEYGTTQYIVLAEYNGVQVSETLTFNVKQFDISFDATNLEPTVGGYSKTLHVVSFDNPVILTPEVNVVQGTQVLSDAVIVYASADENIVHVDGNVLNIVGEGETTVVGTYDNNSFTIYIKVVHTVTITWVDDQNNVIATEKVVWGTMPDEQKYIPQNYNVDGKNYVYSFAQWQPQVNVAKEDTTYRAQMDVWAYWYGYGVDEIGALEGASPQQLDVGGSGDGNTVITTEAALRHDYQRRTYYRLSLQSSPTEMFDISQYRNISFNIATISKWGWNSKLTDKNGNVILTFVDNNIHNIVITNNGAVYVDGFLAEGASMTDGVELYIDRTNVEINELGLNYMTLEYSFPQTNVNFVPLQKTQLDAQLLGDIPADKGTLTSAVVGDAESSLGVTTIHTLTYVTGAWYNVKLNDIDISSYDEVYFYVKINNNAKLLTTSGQQLYPSTTAWSKVVLTKNGETWNVSIDGMEKGTISTLADFTVDCNGTSTEGEYIAFTNLVAVGAQTVQ